MKENAPKTLGEKTAEDLIALIQERKRTAGDRIPTESELAKLLGVSRNTVREALRVLVSRNIVVIRQGAGIFVSDKRGIADDPLGFAIAPDRRKLTEDLLQIRTMIEPPIAALAAQNATVQEVDELEKILLEIEKLITDKENYAQRDVDFHVQIAKCSHNTVISNLVPVISSGVSVFSDEVQEIEYRQTLISHRRILEAIKNRRPEEAREQMQFHLLYNSNRYRTNEVL